MGISASITSIIACAEGILFMYLSFLSINLKKWFLFVCSLLIYIPGFLPWLLDTDLKMDTTIKLSFIYHKSFVPFFFNFVKGFLANPNVNASLYKGNSET